MYFMNQSLIHADFRRKEEDLLSENCVIKIYNYYFCPKVPHYE